MNGDIRPGLDASVHAHISGPGYAVQLAGGRQEVAFRVLGVDANLDGMAIDPQVLLYEGEGLSRSDLQLQFHQVQAKNCLRHRMFDLQARVHLHEVEVLSLHDELDRARADVVDGARGAYRRLAHGGPQCVAYGGRGCFFHDFLVPSLGGTVPLEQVHHVSVAISKYLHLYVLWLLDQAFEQDPVIAERSGGFPPGTIERRPEALGVVNAPHTASAATRRSLDQ